MPDSVFSRFRLPPLGGYLRAHHVTRAGLVVLAIAAAITFFVLGAALRLLVGPVSLGPFSNALSEGLARALPGVAVKYDQAAIEWTRSEGKVNLVILGTRVFDDDGRIIAQAPKADIDLAVGPFLEGKIEVKRITLVGVQLTLVRTRDGGLRLGVERDAAGKDILGNLTDAITATSSKTSPLQSFAVRDARLAIYDQVTGLFVVAPRATLKVETSGPNVEASFDANIEIAGRPAKIKAHLVLPPQKGPVNGDVALSGLDLDALGSHARAFAFLKGMRLATDLTASFTIDHGAHLAAADFGADASGKVVLPNLLARPVAVSTLHLIGRYDGTNGRLLLDDAALRAEGASTHLTGLADFTYDKDHRLSGIGVEVAADATTLPLSGKASPAQKLDRVALRGRYGLDDHAFFLDHLGLRGGTLSADLAGKIVFSSRGSPAIALKGLVAAMPVRSLVSYWPSGIGAGARGWIADNIFAGKIGPIAVETNLASGALDQRQIPDSALSLTFPFGGAEANYVKGLTHLTAVNGHAKLSGDTFVAEIGSARIGPLAVSKGKAIIPNLHVAGAPGDVTAHVEGTLTDVLRLLDHKPLGYPTRFNIDPADTKGNVALDLGFHIPMVRNLSVDAVGISTSANVTGLEVALGPRVRFSDGTLALKIDNTKLEARGSASLAGSRLALTWQELFKTKDPLTTRLTATGMMDRGAREALALRTEDFMSGPMGVNATIVGHRGQLTRADMDLDLGPAAIDFGLLGINKPAGSPATAHVVTTFGPGNAVRAEDIHVITPGGAGFTATASFGSSGTLNALDIPAVHFGAANDFSFSLTRSSSGVDVVLRGHSLDGSHVAQRGSGGNSNPVANNVETFDGPFHVSAKLDQVVLRDGVTISPFALDAAGVGDRPQSMTLSGSLGRAPVAGSIVAAAAGRKVSFDAGDAGSLVHGLFGLTGMKGGQLDLAATLPGHAGDTAPKGASVADFQGSLVIRDATLTNQSFFGRLLMASSFVGIGNLLGGQGLAIDKAEVPFSSKNGVISVHDARATGPTIGATADGYIDRPKNTVALKGALAPVLGVDFNQMLSAIPIVGSILVSKKGEGILGVTYTMNGRADEPNVAVNPLSVLTPGIFRRLFQGRMPTAEQAPSNAASLPGSETHP